MRVTRGVSLPNPFSTNRPQALYAALVLLLGALIFGGASRLEVGTTAIARLFALGALTYMFWRRRGSSMRIGRSELIFWVLLFLVPIVQMIPLPWSLWTSFPGRALAKTVFDAIGDQPAMPISLVPSRTLDFLLALIVPFGAYLIGTQLDYDGRRILLRAILIVAVLSAALGLMQLSGGTTSRLYFYAITNSDSSVGFFSNANHFSLFLAAGIIIALAWLGDSMAVTGRIMGPAVVAIGLAILVLLFGIAGTGSRAGAIFSVVALIVGLAMLPFGRIGVKRSYVLGGSAVVMTGLVLGVTLILNGTLLSGRFKLDDTDERGGLLPLYQQIAHDFFPFGSGLGSFETVFKTYETPKTLSFAYLNQAHNDYAQTLIETGLAGALLVGAFLMWYAIRVFGLWRNPDPSSRMRRQQASAALIVAMVLAHSAVDYPMRTAAMAAVFAFCVAFLVAPADTPQRTGRIRVRKRRSGPSDTDSDRPDFSAI